MCELTLNLGTLPLQVERNRIGDVSVPAALSDRKQRLELLYAS